MKKNIIFLAILTAGFLNKVHAQKYKFGKVSKEELEEQFYPLDSTAEAVYLYKSKNVRFDYDDGFYKIEDVFVRIKIYNKEGFKNGNQSILFYNPGNGKEDRVYAIKAVTYNLIDGDIEEQKVNKKEIYLEKKNKYYSYKKISFPNLKEGSVIELKYKLKSQYYSIPVYWIQEDIPTKKLEYATIIPEYFDFKKTVKGYHMIAPKVEHTSGTISFGQEVISYSQEKSVFEDENIPALKNDEPFTSNYGDYRGVIGSELASYQFPGGFLNKFSSTWEDVCTKLYDSYSFGHELKKKFYFKKDLEKILAVAESDESAKMLSVFEFVKSKVKWNEYYGIYTNKGVSIAYKKGEGNICEVNLILVAMLKSAGLKAHPVLLSTKKHGTPLFPTLNGLNYVIAGVETEEGRVVLLDASEKYNGVNVLPTRDINWQGRLLIDKNVNIPVSLVPKQKSEEFYVVNVNFDKNFKLSGNMMAKYTQREALKFRNKYNTFSDEKLKEKLESKFNLNLDNVTIKNKQDVYKPVLASFKVSSEKYCESIKGKKYIDPLLFLKETKSPFKLETRKYPVDLVNPYKETKTVTIKIPEGYKVVSLPKSIKTQMNENAGSYTFLINQSGNTINIKSVKQFNTSAISIFQYHELKDLYKNLVTKNKEKIVLEKI